MNNARKTNDADAYGKTVWSWRPLLVSSCRWRHRSNRIRPAIKPAATVTRRIRRRGEHGISRKATAQGMPECSDCTCMLVCVFLCALCTRDRGCSVHPAFPAPSLSRDKNFRIARARCAAGRERMSFIRHCEPTGRANARPLTGSAKQSMSPRKGRMDCFVALLLAMTAEPPLARPGYFIE